MRRRRYYLLGTSVVFVLLIFLWRHQERRRFDVGLASQRFAGSSGHEKIHNKGVGPSGQGKAQIGADETYEAWQRQWSQLPGKGDELRNQQIEWARGKVGSLPVEKLQEFMGFVCSEAADTVVMTARAELWPRVSNRPDIVWRWIETTSTDSADAVVLGSLGGSLWLHEGARERFEALPLDKRLLVLPSSIGSMIEKLGVEQGAQVLRELAVPKDNRIWEQVVIDALRHSEIDTMARSLLSQFDGYGRKGAIVAAVAEAVCGADPEKGAQLCSEMMSEGKLFASVMARSVTEKMYSVNPRRASEWVSELPRGPVRDVAARELADGLVMNTPLDAMAWAMDISDPSKRSKAIRELHSVWASQFPEAADSWLKENENALVEEP